MFLLPALAAFGASAGWATGIVLAQVPARRIGAFEFTRIQLVACAAIMGALCSLLGYWPSVDWRHWPSFAASICIGIILGNLAMIECLRRGGPRQTELLLSLKAPLVAAMAFVWLGESLSAMDILGAGVILAGLFLAIFFGGGDQGVPARGNRGAVIALGVAATLCQGFGFLVMKPAMLAGTEPLAASAIRLLGAGFVISVVALWPAPVLRSRCDMSPGLLGKTILPGVIGYGVSSSLLLYAFANYDAGIAAVLGSLSPVLVLPILWFRDGRAPTPQATFGAVLAVTGTAILIVF